MKPVADVSNAGSGNATYHGGTGQYHFGPFLLDAAERRVTRAGEPIALQPRAFDLLALMVANPGRLMTKQALLDRIWAGAVVTENSLTQCIRQIRAALDDPATVPRIIETVPRIGYRFIAAVEPGTAASRDNAATLRPVARGNVRPFAPVARRAPQRPAVELANGALPEVDASGRLLYVQGSARHGDVTLFDHYRDLFQTYLAALAPDTRVTIAVIEESHRR
jgi:DNA-binding winged helix-turn-helix (wHTH) protein